MKLASLARGGRDGTLIIVDHQIRRGVDVPRIARTMREAIEGWHQVEGPLQAISEDLAAGRAEGAFDVAVDELASPLPRSVQFLDGSVYLHHMEKARAARGASMPANYKTEPIMYQGASDRFVGPREAMLFPSEADEIDYEAEIAVVVDDVPMGTAAADAARHIKLVMLLNDWTLRAVTKHELPRGFGFLQAKPTSSFGPVAVTLDELGDAWDGERFKLRVSTAVNGTVLGNAHADRDMFFTYPELIAHACRTRDLTAGTIIAAGAISNQDPSTGHGCLAEVRIAEAGEGGEATTPWLRFGDVVKVDALDSSGTSVLGTIDQVVARVPSPAERVVTGV